MDRFRVLCLCTATAWRGLRAWWNSTDRLPRAFAYPLLHYGAHRSEAKLFAYALLHHGEGLGFCAYALLQYGQPRTEETHPLTAQVSQTRVSQAFKIHYSPLIPDRRFGHFFSRILARPISDLLGDM